MRWQPAVRTLPPYYDDPVYIDALASRSTPRLARLDFEPEVVLASFHGLPQAYLDKGDPYHCQCQKTTRLLRERLGWPKDRLRITFQSRFGRAEWLQPYTDVTLAELARQGVKQLAVITPGFSADCLETLEEIAIRGGGDVPRERRRALCRHPLPQRQRRGHAHARTPVRARAAGLDLSPDGPAIAILWPGDCDPASRARNAGDTYCARPARAA